MNKLPKNVAVWIQRILVSNATQRWLWEDLRDLIDVSEETPLLNLNEDVSEMSLKHCMRHLRDGSEMHPWWLGMFSEYLFLANHHLWKLFLPEFCILHHLLRFLSNAFLPSKFAEYSKTDGKSILLFIF